MDVIDQVYQRIGGKNIPVPGTGVQHELRITDLENKINDTKGAADGAQSTADNASAKADQALINAANANEAADGAQSTADNASAKADQAQETANRALAKCALMVGASTSANGKEGLVPMPAQGKANRYLCSDGTWEVPPDTNTTYAIATPDANGLMSANDKAKLDSIEQGSTNTPAPPAPASSVPHKSGTPAVGTSAKYAREDHVHPMPDVGNGLEIIDNRITLASAAYKGKTDFYVNAGGSDLNDGLTAATAFKTLDRALDVFEMFPLKPYMTIHLGEGHFPLPNRTTNLNGLKLLGAGKTKTFLEWDGSLVSRHFNLMFINCAMDLKDLTLNLTNIPDDNTAIILDRTALHIVDSQVCVAKVANSTKQGDVFEVANQSYLRIQDSEIDCKNGNFGQLFMFYASAMLCHTGHSFKNAKVYQVLGLVGGSCVYMGVNASTFSNVTADAKGSIYGSTLTTNNSYSLIPGTAAFTVARAGQIE